MSQKKDNESKMNITFIGSLKSVPKGGETVKNSILVNALENKSLKLNTINILMPKLSLLKNLFKLFFVKNENLKNLIMSLSTKARLLFIPYAFFLIKINNYRVILLPIGGKIYDEIDNMPSPLKKMFIKFLDEFDQVYVESKQLKRELNDLLSYDIVSYLPNFKKKPDDVSKTSQGDENKLEMVYLGRMAKDKGVFDLLSAFDILKDDDIDIELHFYGTFPKNDALKKKFQKKVEGEEKIIHHGYLSDEKLIETLSNHHVFVFPTYHRGECFPGVLLDAFFSGLPVIASDWRFNSEIVKDGKNGLLCEPKNPKDLAEKIKKLYGDEELLKEMSKNAFEMSEKFDVDNVIDGLLDDLKEFGWFNQ